MPIIYFFPFIFYLCTLLFLYDICCLVRINIFIIIIVVKAIVERISRILILILIHMRIYVCSVRDNAYGLVWNAYSK